MGYILTARILFELVYNSTYQLLHTFLSHALALKSYPGLESANLKLTKFGFYEFDPANLS